MLLCMSPHTTIFVSSYCYIKFVSSYYSYICVLKLGNLVTVDARVLAQIMQREQQLVAILAEHAHAAGEHSTGYLAHVAFLRTYEAHTLKEAARKRGLEGPGEHSPFRERPVGGRGGREGEGAGGGREKEEDVLWEEETVGAGQRVPGAPGRHLRGKGGAAPSARGGDIYCYACVFILLYFVSTSGN
jgi:hypothetical protein